VERGLAAHLSLLIDPLKSRVLTPMIARNRSEK
jgi:hypothetical protein